MTVWGGRFQQKVSDDFRHFNDSLAIDKCMLPQDIVASIAWAKALEKVGVLTRKECQKLQETLQTIADEVDSGKQVIALGNAEDIHSWVEAQLIEKVGSLGKKLHTGRSRNDQVVTDLKLWIKHTVPVLQRRIIQLQKVLCVQAEQHTETVMPGFTHWQQAQPIVFGHWCLSYTEMLSRDAARLDNALALMNQCPLGSGALAGTSYPVDREVLASSLGFQSATANSLDAVSDRDYVLDIIYAASVSMMHLSRMAEDLIFFNSDQVGFVSFSDAVTSGSSLMPQKKNPDAWELVRGKTGSVFGQLVNLLTTLKALPMAYNKDLQADKSALFNVLEDWTQCLEMSTLCVDEMRVHSEVLQAAVENSFCNATELADALVVRGVPFREAHDIVGKCVVYALDQKKTLDQLNSTDWSRLLPEHCLPLNTSVLHWSCALNKKNVKGGTACNQVADAAKKLKRKLEKATINQEQQVFNAIGEDIPAIVKIVKFWAEAGENLSVSRLEIEKRLSYFKVAKKQGRVTGCGSLHIYDPTLAEIRSLGMAPEYHGHGGGKRLVNAFVKQARLLGIKKVFVLTRVPLFFTKLGFVEVMKETLPEKVMKDCQFCLKRSCCDEVAMVVWL